MVYQDNRRRAVLFGGDDGTSNGETWEWDGTEWALRATTGPSARVNHAIAFDKHGERAVLFGGQDGTQRFGDTWEWDGYLWRSRAISAPSPRAGHMMSYDTNERQIILFGGYDGVSALGDTWQLSSTVTAAPMHTQPPSGRDVPPEQSPVNEHLWSWDASSSQFVSPKGGKLVLNPDVPTYVLVHGWNSALNSEMVGSACPAPAWAVSSIGCAVRHARPNANLIAWEWKGAANPNRICDSWDDLSERIEGYGLLDQLAMTEVYADAAIGDALRSGNRAPIEGGKLAEALLDLFRNGAIGPDLHFIGNSHGGAVSGSAAYALAGHGLNIRSVTTLDTPRARLHSQAPYLIDSLQWVRPMELPNTRFVNAYFPFIFRMGFGNPLESAAGNVTNLEVSAFSVPPLAIAHTWIVGENQADCHPGDGWYPPAVSDYAETPPPIGFFFFTDPNYEAASLLDFERIPVGNWRETSQLHFYPISTFDGPPEPPTPSDPLGGLSEIWFDPFDTGETWFATSTQLVSGADPADPTNRGLLLSEVTDACAFRDIVWPRYGYQCTFDYLFRGTRGTETLTVYLDNEIVYYLRADIPADAAGLRTSPPIFMGHLAGDVARLNFVLHTDGTPGGEIFIDNVRVWGLPRGDLDCDGRVTFNDIGPFVTALVGPVGYEAAHPLCHYDLADTDGNGSVNFADIDAFIMSLVAWQ